MLRNGAAATSGGVCAHFFVIRASAKVNVLERCCSATLQYCSPLIGYGQLHNQHLLILCKTAAYLVALEDRQREEKKKTTKKRQ